MTIDDVLILAWTASVCLLLLALVVGIVFPTTVKWTAESAQMAFVLAVAAGMVWIAWNIGQFLFETLILEGSWRW